MATGKSAGIARKVLNSSKRKKGVHSKKKSSTNKNSKLYKKPYNSQGR